MKSASNKATRLRVIIRYVVGIAKRAKLSGASTPDCFRLGSQLVSAEAVDTMRDLFQSLLYGLTINVYADLIAVYAMHIIENPEVQLRKTHE